MEHAIVMDANVAVKLYIAEEFSDLAEALVTNILDSDMDIYAPFHFRSEVINTIHKQQHQEYITIEEADQAIGDFLRLPVILTSSEELYQRAVHFSRERGIPVVYDSLYAVLAEELEAEFWTNDRRFIRQAGPSAHGYVGLVTIKPISLLNPMFRVNLGGTQSGSLRHSMPQLTCTVRTRPLRRKVQYVWE